jgi:CHAT domain-containing protein
VLIVGNPAIDRREFADLTLLRGAEKEATEIAALYRNHRLLLGDKATKSAILENLKTADVFHLAGHAVVNSDAPMLSRIALAPDIGGKEGGIFASELYHENMIHTRVVVLSACSTAIGGKPRLEGIESLVRPFFAAGVPVVIGSLEEIGDKLGAEFMGRFHRRLSAGEGVLESFRKVQLEFLRSNDRSLSSPRAWAAFVISGGVEPKSKSL